MSDRPALARLTSEEWAAVESLRRQLQAVAPGVKVTTSDVLRHALASAVAAMPAGVTAKPGTHALLDEGEAQEQQAPRKRKKEAQPPE